MNKLFTFLALLAICSACAAQETPAGVTKEQVRAYQESITIGCKNRGYNAGNPRGGVDSLCSCVSDRLRAIVPFEDWQRAFYYAKRGEHQAEQTIIVPYARQIKDCKSSK